MKTVGIIPARMNSTRFPGKPLVEINFRPMIQWVYEAGHGSELHDVCIATDSKNIYQYCSIRGMKCYMTGQHETGTERVAEIAESKYKDSDIIVNLQCDEPLLQSYMINKMLDNIIDYDADVETIGVQMQRRYVEMFKRNVVKVTHDQHNFATQFARRMYPWFQFGKKHYPKQHVGVYVFRKHVLEEFIKLPRTQSEIDNSLEQLRLMDHNYTIHLTICNKYMIGVDTPEDVVTIEKLIQRGLVHAT